MKVGVGRRGKPENSMTSPLNVFPTKFRTLCGRYTHEQDHAQNVTDADGTVLISFALSESVCACVRACECFSCAVVLVLYQCHTWWLHRDARA